MFKTNVSEKVKNRQIFEFNYRNGVCPINPYKRVTRRFSFALKGKLLRKKISIECAAMSFNLLPFPPPAFYRLPTTSRIM